MKQFVIDIGDDGEIKLETRGFQGKACLEESKFIKDILGKETAMQLTAAYYTDQGQKQTVKKHLPLCG